MTGTTTEPTNEGQTEDEDDGIIITGGPGISNEPEQTTEDEQEDTELTEDENTSEPEQTEETSTEPDTEESVEAEEDMVPEENSENEVDSNDSEATEESVDDTDTDTETETNTNPEMTESEPEAVESEAEQTEENEEVHTEAPTGADPDGTVDVAGDEEETVPEEPTTSHEDAEVVDTEDDSSDDSPETETNEAFSAIIEGSTIANALDSVSVLVDECKIRLKPDEMTIRAVDPANVGMVDLGISAEAFESYKGGGESNVIGVNLGRFEDIIGMANSGDLVQMELNERTRKLEIHIDGLSYTLALIDPDSIRQEPDIPNLDLPAEVVVEGRQINRGITAADMVSDHITLRVDEREEAFFIEAEGDTDDVDLKLSSDDLVDINAGPANSLFSLDYLKDMNKAIPKTAEVTMEVGEEFPVKLHYTLDDGRITVTYMLAPRIQSD